MASIMLVEADPPVPDLTVTLPADLVSWVVHSDWYSPEGRALQQIIRAAKDAQEA